MEFEKDINGDVCSVKLIGQFTFSDNTIFRTMLEGFSSGNFNQVVLDLSELTFVDSAALGMLLLTRDESEKGSWKLALKKPTGQPKKMFEISKFYDLFQINE